VSWIERQPILDFADSVSEAVSIASARRTYSLAVPSKKSANRYAEHLGGSSPICPAFLKVRPTPSAHVFLFKKSSRFRCPLFATMEEMDIALAVEALPEGCLSGRTFRRAAPLTSLGEFFEIGKAVQHSTPDFYERGPTTTASFTREETSTDAQVGGCFRFVEQLTAWKARYVRSGLAGWNRDLLVHRVPPRKAHSHYARAPWGTSIHIKTNSLFKKTST
jgi:hypothetical protein